MASLLPMSLTKMVTVCVLLLLLTGAVRVLASPMKFSRWSEYVEARGKQFDLGSSKCKHGGPIRDLCERCSKHTKNEVVFPLCCEDKEGVRTWCKKFMEYTLEE